MRMFEINQLYTACLPRECNFDSSCQFAGEKNRISSLSPHGWMEPYQQPPSGIRAISQSPRPRHVRRVEIFLMRRHALHACMHHCICWIAQINTFMQGRWKRHSSYYAKSHLLRLQCPRPWRRYCYNEDQSHYKKQLKSVLVLVTICCPSKRASLQQFEH